MQDSLNYSNSLVRDKQAKMRDFIRQTGQNRDYFREQNYPKENYQNNIESTKNNLTFDSNNDIIKNNSKVSDNDLRIKRAKEYAKNTLGFSIVEYEKINPDFAELINSETSKIYEIFGNLHKSGHLEGVVDYQKKSNFFAAYHPMYKVILMKNVSSPDAIYEMEKTIQKNFKAGFWSSDSKSHIIRHELGHAVQHYLTDNNPKKLQKISKIRNRIMLECNIFDYEISYTEQNIKKAGEFISYYALKNEGELIAESIAEYMNGNPRVVAKEVVDILLDLD